MASEKLNNFLTELKIGEIENLFGTNGSREVPDKLVDDDLLAKTVRVKINGNSRVSGTVKLKGIGNYAKYEGSYYFLDIVTPLDNNKNIFSYAFYRDEGAEFLVSEKHVKGTLVKTNIEEVLGKHLQTTSPVVANPGKISSIRLSSETEFISGVLKVTLPEKPLPKTWVITKQRFEEYVQELKDNNVQLSGQKAQGNAWSLLTMGATAKIPTVPTGDMSVVAKLLMTEVDHWGNEIIDLLKAGLKENDGCLNICQVNNSNRAGIDTGLNKFKSTNGVSSVYCVEACGETGFLSDIIEENNYISDLDLSGLTSVVGIDPLTGDLAKGNKNVLQFFSHKHETPDKDIGMFINKNGVNYKDPTKENNGYNTGLNERGRYSETVVDTYMDNVSAETKEEMMSTFNKSSEEVEALNTSASNKLKSYPLYVLPDYAAYGYKNFHKTFSNVNASEGYGIHSGSNQSGYGGLNSITQMESVKLVTNGSYHNESTTSFEPVITEISCPGLRLLPGDVCKISSQDVGVRSNTVQFFGDDGQGSNRNIKRFDNVRYTGTQVTTREYFITPKGGDQGPSSNKPYVFDYIRPPVSEKIKGMGLILQIKGDTAPRSTRGRYEYPYYCQLIESHNITIPTDVDDKQKLIFKDWSSYSPFQKRPVEYHDGFFKQFEDNDVTLMFKSFEGFKHTPQDSVPTRTLTLGQFSDFMLNTKNGSITSYKYDNLPSEAQTTLDDYKGYLSKNPGMWEILKRENTSKDWNSAKVRAAKTYNRAGVGPNDPVTGDPEYLKATVSGNERNLYLTTQDELTRHTLHFSGSRWASNYNTPINNDIGGKLPRSGSTIRTGEYICGDLKTLLSKNRLRREWYYDLIRPKKWGNVAKYLGDVEMSDYSSSDLERLDRNCGALYNRFSPELNCAVDSSGENGLIAGPRNADYQTQTQIFDLVGTNYYMAILQNVNGAKPKISLIVKDNTGLDIVDNEMLTIKNIPTHEINIITAINQTNVLFLDGHTAALKTKFSFSDEENKRVNYQLSLNSFDLPTEGLTEYYSYTFKGPLEYIDNQYSITKKRAGTDVNVFETERLRLDREMYTEQRVINQSMVAESRRANTTSLNTAYHDYSLQNGESYKSVITGGVLGSTTAVGGSVAAGIGLSAIAAGGAVAGPIGAAIGALVGTATAIAGAVEASEKAATQSMKTARDLAEREASSAKQFELSKNQADHTHRYAEIQMRRELDRASNQYINPMMSDKNILDAYLSLSGKPRYHIIHSHPSDEIKPYLEAFFNEYGSDVLVSDYTLKAPFKTFTDHQTSYIYQFTTLQSSEIKDVHLLRSIQERLKNGIKIISK